MKERYYSWALILYDYVDNVTELELILLDLLKRCIISNYIFVLHNKDENENHIHLGVTFKQHVALSQVKLFLECKQNVLGIRLNDKKMYYDYLLHNDEECKATYDIEDIHTNNLIYFNNNKIIYDKDNVRMQNMIEDYLNGEKYLYMALKYGRDWVINYDRYKDYFDLIRSQEDERKTILNK